MIREGFIALATLIATLVATRFALGYLRRGQILDRPNERSSHTLPTPRGLGIGVVPIVICGWVATASLEGWRRDILIVCTGAVVLGLVAWIDDVRGLPAGPRLLVQLAVVAAGLWSLDSPAWLPQPFAAILAMLLWVGLINQVNFTDGIDGHLGVMGVSVGSVIFAASLVVASLRSIGPLALIIAGACLGFLPLNWHKAKAFMGDVGSVPLGYLTGWLLLRTLAVEQWAVAGGALLFYFLDTAVTYGGRIARRERFWQPHKLYLYQRAAAGGLAHSRIVTCVALCNVCLGVVVVLASVTHQWLALLGFVPALATYGYLSRFASPTPKAIR